MKGNTDSKEELNERKNREPSHESQIPFAVKLGISDSCREAVSPWKKEYTEMNKPDRRTAPYTPEDLKRFDEILDRLIANSPMNRRNRIQRGELCSNQGSPQQEQAQ